VGFGVVPQSPLYPPAGRGAAGGGSRRDGGPSGGGGGGGGVGFSLWGGRFQRSWRDDQGDGGAGDRSVNCNEAGVSCISRIEGGGGGWLARSKDLLDQQLSIRRDEKWFAERR